MADEHTIRLTARQEGGFTDYHYLGLKDGRWGYRHSEFEMGAGRPVPKEIRDAVSRP